MLQEIEKPEGRTFLACAQAVLCWRSVLCHKFIKELPANGQPCFLNLKWYSGAVHMCWQYAPRSKEGLFSFTFHHFKLLKHATVLSAMKNALIRSRSYQVATSFSYQDQRSNAAGFPEEFSSNLAEVILWKLRRFLTTPSYSTKERNLQWCPIYTVYPTTSQKLLHAPVSTSYIRHL